MDEFLGYVGAKVTDGAAVRMAVLPTGVRIG
jgi:hypothetical protein